MPEMDTRNKVDLNDLADDDVRSIEDAKVREVIYEVTKKIKEVLSYHEQLINSLYEAVTEIENQL